MNPRLVLSLWRERWGKTADMPVTVPYLEGKLNLWGRELTHTPAWLLPGMTLAALLICGVLFGWMLTVRLSLREQLVFSVFFVGVALYVRRYAGMLVTLFLIGMSFIVSTRYLYWRFTETLGHNFNWDFVVGFGLCAAELYLALLIALGWINTVWRLKQAPVPLAGEAVGWPTVDIFVPVQGHSHGSIRQGITTALAFDWPSKKIKVYILEDEPRDDIKELADSLGVGYFAYPNNIEGKAGNINHALPETKGELIAIFECDQVLDKGLLQSVVGWFEEDKRLGMIQTPDHFLAPVPSARSLKICNAQSSPGRSIALLRRAMLTDAGGIASAPVNEHGHTALKLQALGYGHAYVGFARIANLQADAQTQSGPLQPRSTPELVRVDGPFLGNTLEWKQRLHDFHAMLHFYWGAVRLVFLTAPLGYLLAGVYLIQTSPDLLIAYAVPHLLQARFVQARMHGSGRFTVWADLRETALACYLLVPTTMTLLRTELAQWKARLKVSRTDAQVSFDWMIAVPFAIVFALNLAGLATGTVRWLWGDGKEPEIAVFYLCWAACNLMWLAALLAVAEETRHIHRHARLRLKMPAMIQMPSGRTLSCVTNNFPAATLALELPCASPLAVDAGLQLAISIFRDHREFTFPAHVVSCQGKLLHVAIDDTAQSDYQRLGIAVFSRGQDWPKWLPGRNADHPLPAWVTRPLIAVGVKTLLFIEKLGNYVGWKHFGNWIRKWKKAT